MAEVKSTFQLKIGDKAPAFCLQNENNQSFTLEENKGEKGTLIIFVCNHCPFVIHIAKQLGEIAKKITDLGINTIAINANDIENYPEDSPQKMLIMARKYAWDFPYLFDKLQEVAKSYSAACTPDFFLFNKKQELHYAGQFDDSRPNNKIEVTGESLQEAIDNLIADKAPLKITKPASGCNIKWIAGNEPTYFLQS